MKIRSKVVSDLFDAEVVVVNLETGIYYSMKETAMEIWNLLSNNLSAQDILNSFTGLRPEEKQKIETFIGFIIAEGLAEETDNTPPLESSKKLEFDELIYTKFDDMSDLIMIDPIHEADETKGWPNKSEKN
jgi:hypothetical protein